VENGNDIFFWTDRWLGDEVLCVRFQRLFDLSDNRWTSIVEWLGWGKGRGAWSWRRRLRAPEDVSSYRSIWSPDPVVGYIVRDLYNILARENLHQDLAIPDTIWQRHIPLKVSLFVWRLLHNRVHAKVNLFKHRIISFKDQLCVSGYG